MQRFSGIRSAGKNSAFLLANQAASILIRFAYLFVLVRAVTPASYGALNYALSWYLLLLPITFLGAEVVLGREIGRSPQSAPELLGGTLSLRICAAIILMAACIGAALSFEGDPAVRRLIVVFSFALVGRSLWMWSAAVFTAFEEARGVPLIDIPFRLIEFGLLLLLLNVVGAKLEAIGLIHALSWTLEGLVSVAVVWRRHPISFSRPTLNWFKPLHAGMPGAALSISMAALLQLPVVLFRHFNGISPSLGYFALAFQIVTFLLNVPYVVAYASLPVLARSAARKDGKDRAAALVLIAVIVFGGAIAAIAGSLVAAPFVGEMFGRRYIPSALILSEGLWLLIPGSLALLLQHLLFSNGVRSASSTVAPCIAVATMVLAFPELTRANGSMGALASVGLGLTLWAIIAAAEAIRTGVFMRPRRAATIWR
jgi:O-antigen/teichoic acid export membrane protein